eukprot:COSAG06_NODE_65254_length_257_cov_0.974684_1_plen_51_part_10
MNNGQKAPGSRGTFFGKDVVRVGNPLLWAESERAAGAAVRGLREGGAAAVS